MLTAVRRTATVAALSCIGLLAGAGLAVAGVQDPGPTPVGGGGGTVTCPTGAGSCQIGVATPGTPGAPGDTTSPSQGGGGSIGSSGGGSGATPSPEPTLINGSCVYAADPGFVPQPADGDPHTGQQGAWYLMTCPDGVKPGTNIATTKQQMVWLTTPPPPALMQPTPAVLADRARNSLVLPKPVIGSNPPVGSPQWVGVPTWSFLPASLWTAVSARAAVPGMSVTATATPGSVTWDYGDGTSTTCSGPGTPFAPGTDPKASSPDCGHTYRTSSGSVPGGKYQVSATITWRVTWVGAGQVGVLNGLTTTATIPVTVLQSQAIVTTG